MRKVRRRFDLSKCNGYRYIFETNDFEDFYVEYNGNYTPERATNKARKETGDNSIVITNVEIVSETYAISAEDFKAYGERIK